MVETRHGAYLWNVRTNVQYLLTASYNTTTGRNFSRLRWDATNAQVSVNLAVGGREVYDLTNGQQIAEAANVTDSIKDTPGNTGNVVIGGKAYECQTTTPYGYRNSFRADGVAAVQVDFDPTNQTLFMRLRNQSSQIESLQMIEDNLNASWFVFGGWSPSCRYIWGHLGVPGQDSSDTAVWDIIDNRRVGTVPDARQIRHPVGGSPVDDALFIQTRHGGYLWHLPSNTQTLMTDEAETALSGQSSIKNVRQYRWEPGRLFVQPLNATASWNVYDVTTGQLVAENVPDEPIMAPSRGIAQIEVPHTPIDGESGYGLSFSRNRPPCNPYRLHYDDVTRSLNLVDLAGDGIIQIIETDLNMTSAVWSPDCQWVYGYVAVVTNETQPYDNRPLDDIRRDRLTRQVVIWDAATWQRRFVLAHPYSYGHVPSIRWSPGGDRIIVYTSNGSYLLNLYTGERVLLTFQLDNVTETRDGAILQPRRTHVYWDYARGQILLNGQAEVYAFDMTTGVERYRFVGGRDYWESRFTVHDNKTLFIMGNESSSVWIWDLDTLEYRAVRLRNWSQIAFGGGRIALSPDGRYLVMGYKTVRVWDLANHIEVTRRGDVTQRPDAAYPIPGTSRWGGGDTVILLEFIDATTVKITMRQGNTYLMNVTTGTVTPVPSS